MSCHSERLRPPLPDRSSPRRKTWVPSPPPHLTVPPARLHIPHLRVQPPEPGRPGPREDAGNRKESPSGLLGPLFLPASSLPGLQAASLPPQGPEPQEPPSGTLGLAGPRPEPPHRIQEEATSPSRAPFSDFHSPLAQRPRGPGIPAPAAAPSRPSEVYPRGSEGTDAAHSAGGRATPPSPAASPCGQNRRRSRVRFGHEGPGRGDTWGRSPAHTPLTASHPGPGWIPRRGRIQSSPTGVLMLLGFGTVLPGGAGRREGLGVCGPGPQRESPPPPA